MPRKPGNAWKVLLPTKFDVLKVPTEVTLRYLQEEVEGNLENEDLERLMESQLRSFKLEHESGSSRKKSESP